MSSPSRGALRSPVHSVLLPTRGAGGDGGGRAPPPERLSFTFFFYPRFDARLPRAALDARRADVARRRREPHAPGAADGEYNTVLDVLDGDAETSDDTVLERPFGEHLLEKWRRVLGNGLVDPPGRGALDEPRRDLSASSEL